MIQVCKLMSCSTFSHHLVCQSAILRWPLCIGGCFTQTLCYHSDQWCTNPWKNCFVKTCVSALHVESILVWTSMWSRRFLPISTTFPLAPTQQGLAHVRLLWCKMTLMIAGNWSCVRASWCLSWPQGHKSPAVKHVSTRNTDTCCM